MNYFLITGLAKSGTTWVQRICRAHPEMYCRAEDQFTKIWDRAGALTEDYNKLVEQRDRERDHQGIDPLTKRDAAKLFYALVKITMDKAPPGTACSGIKDLILSSRGFLQMVPNSRVINVVRDPRDIAISARAHALRVAGLEATDANLVDDATITETCRFWVNQLRLADDARERFPGRTHDIRYEDLISDFSNTVRDLLTFLEVEATPETLERIQRETDFKRLSGGRAPGEADPNSYFRKGVAGDWRQNLGAAQIQRAKELCGPRLIAHGYEPD